MYAHTIVRHSKDGDLCYRTTPSLYTSCPLIDSSQISVHVTWETTTTRHLLTSCWYLQDDKQYFKFLFRVKKILSFKKYFKGEVVYLSKSLSIGAHISEDDEDVFLTLIGQELSCGQGNTGRNDTLNAEMIDAVLLCW